MCKISIKSHFIQRLKYDIKFMDTKQKSFHTKVSCVLDVDDSNNKNNKMKIDFMAYTNEDAPFIDMSIIGIFELQDDLLKKDASYVGDILQEEGFQLLYKRLQDCFSDIIRTANVKIPLIPDI